MKMWFDLEYRGVHIEEFDLEKGIVKFSIPVNYLNLGFKEDSLLHIARIAIHQMILVFYLNDIPESSYYTDRIMLDLDTMIRKRVKFYGKIRKNDFWTDQSGSERLVEMCNTFRELISKEDK